MVQEDRIALTEVNEILKFCDINLVKEIPYEVKKFIENNMDHNYKFEFNIGKHINQQNISQKAKKILAMIYRDYLCIKDENEEKNQVNRKLLMEENMKNYNSDRLFLYKKKEKYDDTDLALSTKETWMKKIKKFLKKILGR